MKEPIAGPRTRPRGSASGPTAVTAMPRARSEAATSSPMKLVPMTTARRADFAASMMCRLSANERADKECVRQEPECPGAGGLHRLQSAAGRSHG